GPRQWPGEPQPTQSVHLPPGVVGASHTTDDRAGLLPAVSQQVQPDRTLLGRPGGLLEWGAAAQRRGRAGFRWEYDLRRQTSLRVSGQPDLRQRRAAEPGRDEGPGTTPGTLGDPAEVVCDHRTSPPRRDHSPLRLGPRRPSSWPPTPLDACSEDELFSRDRLT